MMRLFGEDDDLDLMEDAARVLEQAITAHQPRHVFALFSGGNDSSVTAHVARRVLQERLTGLAHIDTGTALPGVRAFADQFAGWLGSPMHVFEARDAFERMVLGSPEWWEAFKALRAAEPSLTVPQGIGRLRAMKHPARGHGPFGFPGPAGHAQAYQRLKERQVEALVRRFKPWACTRCEREYPGDGDRPTCQCGGRCRKRQTDRIMLLTGVRDAESARRMGAYAECEQRKAQVWVAPLIRWPNKAMREYRQENALPQSDVAALIHRSGECNCGAFAAPGEREMLADLYPEFMAWIEDMEARARELGIPNSKWGVRPAGDAGRKGAPGPMCHDCQLVLAA